MENKVYKSKGNLLCTCKWGSLHPDAWIKGEIICKHIRQYIKEKNED